MKRFLRVVLMLAGIILVAVIAGSVYMLNYSLRPVNRGHDIAGSYEYLYESYPYLRSWVDSLDRHNALRDTFITSRDGYRLHAYFVEAARKSPKTAVIVHGYTDNAIRMFMIGHMYSAGMGYNILLPDLHAHGLSEGKAIRMGWKDHLDVLQWMELANETFGDSTQMVVHGISMGAATTMMLSGEVQQPYVRCFVEDCGYTSVWDEFAHELKVRFNLNPFPLLYSSGLLCRMKYGWGFKEASSLKQVKVASLPMMFIHREEDDFVPTAMVFPLYEAKPEPKEIWTLSGVGHGLAFRSDPQLYLQKVEQFVNQYIE
ncbi:MAG: alpha/beta hydrolase [Bacteroides sp.]|nr:alpha/beta hydrolase [Bacteroides sp.]